MARPVERHAQEQGRPLNRLGAVWRAALLAAALLGAALASGCHGGPDCGTCPAGSSCGSANGAAVCRAQSGVPLFRHVFLILMENTSLSSLQHSQRAPYLAGLAASAATSASYHGVTHPSLPNYLALTSGSTQGVTCDCSPAGARCTTSCSGDCACSQAAAHLGDQLDAAGLSWRAYGEDMGSPCNATAAGLYAPKHIPFLYYDNVLGDAARCASHVVDLGASFSSDLAAAAPTFVFLSPNLDDDMHNLYPEQDKNIANGDAWLSRTVPAILASAAYRDGGVLFIAWDEDDLSGIGAEDDPIPLYVLSPYARAGTVAQARADHYSLLATVEDGLRLPRLGAAAGAAPLTELFAAH